jgi:indole-3-glycerol phosphate synthase
VDERLRQLRPEDPNVLFNYACSLALSGAMEQACGELERALDTEAPIIGVNNRNLKSFIVDLGTTERLSEEIPDGLIFISESGIKTAADARRVFECGANGILVGETLMRADDPAEAIAAFHDCVLEAS